MSETVARARFWGSLNPRDRRTLLAILALVVLVALVVTFLLPPEDDNDPTPSTFTSTSHGARAAYLVLAQSGYVMERWDRPLGELAETSDSHTVLILADPFPGNTEATRAAVAKVLQRGGRVLVTGMSGAMLLPKQHIVPKLGNPRVECAAKAEGFDVLAGSGVPHLRPQVTWSMDRPEQRVQYTCNGDAVVVNYAVGKGQVIWWADAMPLENSAIAQDGDLALLLNSIGPPDGARVVWDESLHELPSGIWSYAKGTPVHLLWAQLGLVAVFLLLSYSRRSGPLLPDPVVQRDAPLEFVHSLGALYDKAGATNTAVRIAYDRFRLSLGRRATASSGTSAAESAQEIVSVVHARLKRRTAELQDNILACEETVYQAEPMPARRALSLIQSLWTYEDEMKHGAGKGSRNKTEDEATIGQ